MFFHTLIAVSLTGLAQLAASQSIDPSTIDTTTKDKWCSDQKSSCPLLCLQIPGASGSPQSNSCSSSNLAYSCVCSDGREPNASEYSQTIPFYVCTQAATNCVNNCASTDTSCQSACRQDNPCGAQNPTRVNTSTISTTAAATTTSGGATASTAEATGSNTFTGFGSVATGSSDSGASERARALALGFGRTYGLAMILAGVTGAFVVVL